MEPYYIKATLEKGKSATEGRGMPSIKYKLGIVIHPDPDKVTSSSCGSGIHLAKSLKMAKYYCPNAKEFYLAHPGVILGEDSNKVRCASCEILKRLSETEIREYEKLEESQQEKMKREERLRQRLGSVYENGGLPGKDWLAQHGNDISQEDIDNQILEIFRDNKRVCGIKARLKRTETRKVLKVVTA
jgi:hypothetical protein